MVTNSFRDAAAVAAPAIAKAAIFGGLSTVDLDRLRAPAVAVCRAILTRAIRAGHESEDVQQEAADLGLEYAEEPDDAARVDGWPIAGHTADEWADHLADNLVWRLRGVLAVAMHARSEPRAVAVSLSTGADAWARSVVARESDAAAAGVTCARMAMREALTSMRSGRAASVGAGSDAPAP